MNKVNHHKNKILTLLLMAVSVFLLSSCFDFRTQYFVYQNTPVQGWEKNDTLIYGVPKLKESGFYQSNLDVRISKAFPFTDLYLVVEQTVLPRMEVIRDTVRCEIADEDGNFKSNGVSYHQYKVPVSVMELSGGDSLHVKVRHCMKRDILPGISDVGYRLVK